MRKHLESLHTPYEFVYGKVLTDAPAISLRLGKFVNETLTTGSMTTMRAAINAMSTRKVMLAANEKFINDGDEWSLIIQDDVRLHADWREQAVWNINNCPAADHAIAVCQHPALPRATEWKVSEGDHTYTETAMLVSRGYGMANIVALREAPSISDYCFWRKYGVSKCFRSPKPFVDYKEGASYIASINQQH